MKKVKLDVTLFKAFNKGTLSISQNIVPLEIELTEGEHIYTTAQMEIGNFLNYKVFGHITIPYSYDPNMHYVTIAGLDDTSEKQISIHTSIDNHPLIVDIHNFNNNGNQFVSPNFWKNYIDSDKFVQEAKQTAIQTIVDTLVKELLNAGLNGVIQTGAAPIVTPDNYKDYKAMFIPQKKDVQQPSINDIIEVQLAVQSMYGGTITWASDTEFANVIGSTRDPKPNGSSSWIQLWASTCNGSSSPTHCSSFNYSDGNPGFQCNSPFVGGHVIPGRSAVRIPHGQTVYIFPICKRHNASDNIFMSLKYNLTGVILNDYFQ